VPGVASPDLFEVVARHELARPIVVENLRRQADAIAPPDVDDDMRARLLRSAAGELDPSAQHYRVYAVCFVRRATCIGAAVAAVVLGGRAVGRR